MTKITCAVDVLASPEAVYQELVDLHRLSRWSTITESHEGPEELELGQEFDQSIRVGGVKLPSHWRCVEREPPRAVAYEATTPLGGRLHMRQTVSATTEGCRVVLDVDYDLPGKAVGALLDRIYVHRRNRRAAEQSLQNLKALVEGER